MMTRRITVCKFDRQKKRLTAVSTTRKTQQIAPPQEMQQVHMTVIPQALACALLLSRGAAFFWKQNTRACALCDQLCFCWVASTADVALLLS